WKADVPANARTGVSTRQLDLPSDQIVLHPFGVLAVSQRVVPLGFPLERFGNKKPDVDQFDLTTDVGDTDEVREEVAIANFRKFSDADKLSKPSFERMRSGLRFSTGDATETGARLIKEVTYELSYMHQRLLVLGGLIRMFIAAFSAFSLGGSVGRNSF